MSIAREQMGMSSASTTHAREQRPGIGQVKLPIVPTDWADFDGTAVLSRPATTESAAQPSKQSVRAPTKPRTQYDVAGLFAGIGGLEEGFRSAGHKTVMLCEVDEAARYVLGQRFEGVTLEQDVNALTTLPECGILTAGFPCQDLSQVGPRLGISGPKSGLITKVFDLLRNSPREPDWLLLENVPFMLNLDKGRGIRWLAEELEAMGFDWAYRTVDALAFGLPQRRRRVLLLASKKHDPRPVLLGQDAGAPGKSERGDHACGFYWTEGNTGLGWAIDAIPPLKSGSALHIPSPPGIWLPAERRIVTPSIQDAERLQGFAPGWSDLEAYDPRAARKRWRMVGNAVSVPMSTWIADRLAIQHDSFDPGQPVELPADKSWPSAAWGRADGTRSRCNASEWPVVAPRQHLIDFLKYPTPPLSKKAAGGFLKRLEASTLRYEEQFRLDLAHHVADD